MVLNYNLLIKKWQDLGLEGLKKYLMNDKSQEAQKILKILNNYSDILEKYPEQLPSQLISSFRDPQDKFIIDFALELAKVGKMTWLIPIAPPPPAEEACVATLHEHGNFVGSIVFLNDYQFITSSEDGTMKVWDLNTKKAEKVLTEHHGPINFMCLSPDKGHLFSASDDFTIKKWNPLNWRVLLTLKGHNDYVSKVAATSSDLIVSISKDQTIKVWDSLGNCLQTLKGHNSWVYCLAVAPDGRRVITASVNSTMIIWDLISGKRLQTIVDGGQDVVYVMGLIVGGSNNSGTGHKNYPTFANWLEDGRIITAAEDIIIWDDTNYKEIKHLEGHPWKIHEFVLFNNNKNLVSVAHEIKIWDLETEKALVTSIGHDGEEIYSIAITPNERYILTGDKIGRIKIWDLKKLLAETKVAGHTSPVDFIMISPDGNFAVTSGYDKLAIIWDTKTGRPVHYLGGHTELDVQVLGFRFEGKELLTASGGQIRIWNTKNGKLKKEILYENDLYRIDICALLPGEKQILCGSLCYRPTLWDLERGTVKSFKLKFGFTSTNVVSQNGRYLLTCTYPTKLLDDESEDESEPDASPAILWDLEKNEIIREFWFEKDINVEKDVMDEGSEKKEKKLLYPSGVLFDPQEEKVIASSSYGHVSVWEKESGQLIKSFKATREYTTNIFLTFDGKIATIGQKENLIKIWNLDDYKLHRTISIPCPEMRYPTISQDHKIIAAIIEGNTIFLIDLEANKKIYSLTLAQTIRVLKFSKNLLFASTEDGMLYGFELIKGKNS